MANGKDITLYDLVSQHLASSLLKEQTSKSRDILDLQNATHAWKHR